MRLLERLNFPTAALVTLLLADSGLQESHDQFPCEGRGVLQDETEGVRWYRLAAEQGYALAQVSLGFMYGMGRGVPQDYVAAHM